jgi:hypothetical protein
VPRRKERDRPKTQRARPEQPSRAGRRIPARNLDEQALELREANSSYSTIARRLELPRATDAHRAFVRAMRSRDGEEHQRLVANEHSRLDVLELRIRDRDAAQPEKIERRLLAVATLRAALS